MPLRPARRCCSPARADPPAHRGNACAIGVTKSEQGAVTIRAEERANAFVVTVQDDGVGYDAETPREDGRNHIGIQNVRGRLEAMCGGTLEITSVPDVGTTAVITLPKEEQGLC